MASSPASTPTTVVDPDAAAIHALSQRLDRMMRMMEEGLAKMNRVPQATSATPSSGPTTPAASPTYATPIAAPRGTSSTSTEFALGGADSSPTPVSVTTTAVATPACLDDGGCLVGDASSGSGFSINNMLVDASHATLPTTTSSSSKVCARSPPPTALSASAACALAPTMSPTLPPSHVPRSRSPTATTPSSATPTSSRPRPSCPRPGWGASAAPSGAPPWASSSAMSPSPAAPASSPRPPRCCGGPVGSSARWRARSSPSAWTTVQGQPSPTSSSSSSSTSPAPATSPASIIALSRVLVTPSLDADKVFIEMPCSQEASAATVIHITVSHLLYPVSEEVMHQLFDPYGAENVQLLVESTQVEALVLFRRYHDAMQALHALNGYCIWDDCCRLDIQYVPPQPMQTSSPRLDANVKVDTPIPSTCSTPKQGINGNANNVGVLLQPELQVFSVVQSPVEGSLGTPLDQRIALPCALAHELHKKPEGIISNSENMFMDSGKLLKIGDDILELNGNYKDAVGGMFPCTPAKKNNGLFPGIGEFFSYGSEVWQPWSPSNTLQIPRIISGDHRVFDRGKFISYYPGHYNKQIL